MSDSIINAYMDSYIISLGEIACTSLYFWDWILTMGDEIDIIWRRKLKTSGYLFIALRYLSFGLMVFNLYAFTRGTFSAQLRSTRTWVRAVVMIVNIFIVQVILQLRVYVMYMRSRTILRVNAVIFAAEIALAVGMWFHFSAKIQYLPFSAHCGYCSIYPRELGICFIPPLLYEASLALLMMRKSWESRIALHQLGHGHTNIFYVLIRDSIIYFILVSSAMAACMIYFFAAPQQALWADMLVDCIGAIGGTRLIISMRRAVELPTTMQSTRRATHTTGGDSFELSALSAQATSRTANYDA